MPVPQIILLLLVLLLFVAGFWFWPAWLIGAALLLLSVIAIVSRMHGGRWAPTLLRLRRRT